MKSLFSMLKLNPVLLVCFILCNLNQDIHSLKLIAQWENTYPSSVVLNQMMNEVLVVGFQNSTVILDTYNPLNRSFVRKICQDIMPSGYDMPMSVMGNGKIVLNKRLNHTVENETILIIFDPLNCSIVKTFKVVEFKEKSKFLVPYRDSFDLFHRYWHKNKTEIRPLRFDSNGEKVDTNLGFKAQNFDSNGAFIDRLFTIKYMDASDGYLGQIFFKTKRIGPWYSMKLQRFNSRFELLNEILLDGPLKVIPYDGRIIRCDRRIYNQTCEILDCNLNSERRVLVPEPYPRPIDPVSVRLPVELLWSDDGFVVVHYVDQNDGVHVYLKDVSFDGSTKVLKLGIFPHFQSFTALMFPGDILCVIREDQSWYIKQNNLMKYSVGMHCFQKQK